MKTKPAVLLVSGVLALGSAAYGTWVVFHETAGAPIAKKDNLFKDDYLDKDTFLDKDNALDKEDGRLEKENALGKDTDLDKDDRLDKDDGGGLGNVLPE